MDVQLLINNRAVSASNGATFERRNPVTGEVASRAAAATSADAIAAGDAAATALPVWSSVGPNQRRAILLRAADLLSKRARDFTELMVSEVGATPPWAHFNVALGADLLREAASMTTQICGEVIPSDKPGCTALAIRQAAGVVLGIAPWNAPVILGVRALAMALACGNTVVMKASEYAPGTHRLIGEVLQASGLPDGAINVVTNAPPDAAEIVQTLIGHPAIRRINFTGSTRVGRLIAECAARHLKPVLLELGGKASVIVLDDADVDAAVNAVAFGAFLNQGQICMSTERVIVERCIADEFVSKLTAKAASLRAGNPLAADVVLGSLVSAEAATRVRELIQEAVRAGAILTGGGLGDGTIMPASVLDNVTPSMRIYSEESFGPVVAVIRVDDIQAAICVANDTEYGLASAIFSRDVRRAISVAKQIQSGICHINGPTVQDEPQMPFGGMKASGYGRFGGRAAIHEFTELRWITVEDPAQQYPF